MGRTGLRPGRRLERQRPLSLGDFRERLVAEIASAEQGDESSSYYESWLASLEKLAVAQGLITWKELDLRTAKFSSDQGHDAPHQPN